MQVAKKRLGARVTDGEDNQDVSYPPADCVDQRSMNGSLTMRFVLTSKKIRIGHHHQARLVGELAPKYYNLEHLGKGDVSCR